ncbi:MAG: hypothetical protein ACE5EF_03390 [Dehalococcoidia bacterium]
MPEFEFAKTEAWNTALRLASDVGRLRVGSNLKAATDAQTAAYEAAGRACALIAEGSALEGRARAGAFREARGMLARAAAWLHVLAAVTNEPATVFNEELDTAERAAHQLSIAVRAAERGPGGPPRFDRPRGGQGRGGAGARAGDGGRGSPQLRGPRRRQDRS